MRNWQLGSPFQLAFYAFTSEGAVDASKHIQATIFRTRCAWIGICSGIQTMKNVSSFVCFVLAFVVLPTASTLSEKVGDTPPNADVASMRGQRLVLSSERELRRKMPTRRPTKRPRMMRPTKRPTKKPQRRRVTKPPSEAPSSAPTPVPTNPPTPQPSFLPTEAPSASPSASPAPSSAPSGELCPLTTLYEGNGHRYLIGPNRVDFSQAMEYAQNLPACCGGKTAHLVTISDKEEDGFVTTFVSGADPNALAILGLTFASGSAEWVTGETVTGYAQPLMSPLGTGPCGHIYGYAGTTGQWGVNNCDASKYLFTVVEYDCEPVTGRRLVSSNARKLRRKKPTKRPTKRPRMMRPTKRPTKKPQRRRVTKPPSEAPSSAPTPVPTNPPTPQPSFLPTEAPSASPSASPAPSSAPSGELCPLTTLYEGNGHRYLIGPNTVDFSQAMEYAQNLPACCGGKVAHLATISDEGEDGFLGAFLDAADATNGILGMTLAGASWEWINGEIITDYAKEIIKSNLDGNDGSCAFLYGGKGHPGVWGTNQCGAAPYYSVLVEYDCEPGP